MPSDFAEHSETIIQELKSRLARLHPLGAPEGCRALRREMSHIRRAQRFWKRAKVKRA